MCVGVVKHRVGPGPPHAKSGTHGAWSPWRRVNFLLLSKPSPDVLRIRVRPRWRMPDYRRVWVPGGTFFFTVNLLERRHKRLLVEHVDHLRASFRDARRAKPFEVIAISVMPEHLHCLWRLPEGDADNASRWARIKSGFSRRLPLTERRSDARIEKRERGIWQRRFWEHMIVDEDDYRNHIDYIHINPVKHGYVRRAVDWPYSSLHGYVATRQLPADWACDPALSIRRA